MGLTEILLERSIAVIPSLIAVCFWVYRYFIRHDLHSTQEILHDRLWTNQPGEDKETILKSMIGVLERRAKTATIIAVWFTVLAVFCAIFL